MTRDKFPIELAANVWPVVDASTGIVLRYFMRAYALSVDDSVIGATLHALAPTDFQLGQMFLIPQRFTVVSEHGELAGCVTIGDFHKHQSAILFPAFAELEKRFARLQGVGDVEGSGELSGIGLIPRFPENPYLLVTILLETPNGQLIPQVRN